VTGGRIDMLRRLIELCTVARRYNVKVILSSWYYLHTFWFTDKNLTAELLGLPLEERLIYFARGLDRILDELKSPAKTICLTVTLQRRQGQTTRRKMSCGEQTS
jgi:hypothetical protein